MLFSLDIVEKFVVVYKIHMDLEQVLSTMEFVLQIVFVFVVVVVLEDLVDDEYFDVP